MQTILLASPDFPSVAYAVFGCRWTILAVIAVLCVGLVKWRGQESKVPLWLKITLAISAFSLVQLLAYRDSMLDCERERHEKSEAIGERDKLKLEVARQQAKLEEKDNLIQLQQNLINKKIVSSLESRTGMPRRAGRETAVTGNRLLDEKRKNILIAMLQSVPAVAEIQEPVNNEEAAGRGRELIEIFGQAGWGLRRIKWIIPKREAPTGIVIRAGANNLAVAAQLEKALSAVGIPARQEEHIGSNDWIEFYVGPK